MNRPPVDGRVPRNIGSMARTAVRTLGIVAAMVLILVVLVVLALNLPRAHVGIVAVRDTLHAVKPALVAGHLVLICALWLLWPRLADRLPARWPDDVRAAFRAARHRICLGLLVFELVVVIGLPVAAHR